MIRRKSVGYFTSMIMILTIVMLFTTTTCYADSSSVIDSIIEYSFEISDSHPINYILPKQNEFVTRNISLKKIFSMSNRVYNNLTLHDMLYMNETEYRINFPYPYWHTMNGTEQHTVRHIWTVPTYFFLHAIGMALFFTVLRLILNPLLAMISRSIGIFPEDIPRFQENVSQALYYIISWTTVASYVLRTEYYYDTFFIWEGNFPNQPLPHFVYFIYILNIGWYLHGFYALFSGLEMIKKDFKELLIHHIVTIIMLYCSLAVGYWRLGVLVLYTHDLCDVFLQIPRIYLLFDNAGLFGPTDKIPFAYQALVFIPLPISWVYFRVWLYPLKVIYPAVTDTVAVIGYSQCAYYLLFVPLLFILYGLQIFWFYLIMATALKKVTGEKWDDVRDPVRYENDKKKN